MTATLVLTSNDPDEPQVDVLLAGVPQEEGQPPVLTVAPHSLDADLWSGGTATRTLMIQNAGERTLEWVIDVGAAGTRGLGADDEADLTGVHILWDRSRQQYGPSTHATLVADLEARGAIVTTSTDALSAALLADHDLPHELDNGTP